MAMPKDGRGDAARHAPGPSPGGTLEGDVPPRLRPGPRIVDADAVHRSRLAEAVVAVVSAKGYASMTIGDIVRAARVSRRTFYEHFSDKESCLLAAYDAWDERLRRSVARAVAGETDWPRQLLVGLGALLAEMVADPRSTRVFLIEAPASGVGATRRRRQSYEQWASLLASLVNDARERNPEIGAISRRLSPDVAQAVVAAIHELVLVAVERDRVPAVPELRRAAADILLGAFYGQVPFPLEEVMGDERRPDGSPGLTGA